MPKICPKVIAEMPGAASAAVANGNGSVEPCRSRVMSTVTHKSWTIRDFDQLVSLISSGLLRPNEDLTFCLLEAGVNFKATIISSMEMYLGADSPCRVDWDVKVGPKGKNIRGK